MPAGTDLQTWGPRVGSSGDDRYDPGDTVPWTAGLNSFSSLPSIAEINASDGLNQIIAERNRRLKLKVDTQGTGSYSALAYVDTDTINLASLLNTLKTDIDTIRSQDELSAFSWTAFSVSSSSIALRQQILELRKALAIDY